MSKQVEDWLNTPDEDYPDAGSDLEVINEELREEPGRRCLYPGRCCMPGEHFSDECHTAEALRQIEREWRKKVKRRRR